MEKSLKKPSTKIDVYPLTNDTGSSPLSFKMSDVYKARMEEKPLTKGQKTLIRLKIGVILALEKTPYQVMRVADITTEAKISYGLFYHYYKDKEHATIDVITDFLNHLETLYADIHPSEDDYDTIYQANLFYLNVNYKNFGLIRACLTLSEEVETFRQNYIKLIDRWHRRMAQSIRRNQKSPDTLLPDADLVAYGVGGMIDQYCRHIYAQQNPFLTRLIENTHHLAETVSILWYRAVYGRSPTEEQIAKCRPPS